MIQPPYTHSVFRPQRPPLWYVTNGDLTVGPVNTSLLVRGVEQGRVPEHCHVRAVTGNWRELHHVREVAALHGSMASGPTFEQLAEWGRHIQRLRDEDELCHTAAWLALVSTGAESVMFHYRGRLGRTLFTRSALGHVSTSRLGYPLSEFDLVVRCARRAMPVQGPPYGPIEMGLAKRLEVDHAIPSPTGAAVAMIPVFVDGELAAIIELARRGHAFRCSDLQRIERVVQRALQLRQHG